MHTNRTVTSTSQIHYMYTTRRFANIKHLYSTLYTTIYNTQSTYNSSIRMVSHQSISMNTLVQLNNGTRMPLFGLGTWRSDKGSVAAAVEEAIKLGYIHIDCAYAYENHTEVAVGIKNGLKAANKQRSDLWITSKLWNTHHHPDRVQQQVDQILNDLQLDYLDQLLIHWPVSWLDNENGAV